MSDTPINLCERVDFQPMPCECDGVGYIGFVSTKPTQVNNGGDCKRIWANLVYDTERGGLALAIESEGQLCVGGFGNQEGTITGALRGVLAGHIVILFTVGDCAPVKSGTRDIPDCEHAPEADPRCYDRNPDDPDPPWNCLHCQDEEYPLIECTIEQNTDEYPCDALAVAGGMAMVLPVGVEITPTPGNWDIEGNDQAFTANQGRTGLVKYYLQERFDGTVNPLWQRPADFPDCTVCKNWLCFYVTHYAGPDAWNLVCTEVLPDPGLMSWLPQACCLQSGVVHEWGNYCEYMPPDVCLLMHGRPMGPTTTCDMVVCGTDPFRMMCCLPFSGCMDVNPNVCLEHGGTPWGSPGMSCRDYGADRCRGDFDLTPRAVNLLFQDPIAVLEFNVPSSSTGRCFRLVDSHCFTSGPDSGACGVSPCWSHLQDGEQELVWIDTIGVDIEGVGYAGATPPELIAYPHAEPEWVVIANQAFAVADDQNIVVWHTRRQNSYDEGSLNHWWSEESFECGEAPVVWPVSVTPYHTMCAYPADLVLSRIEAHLWLSGDPGNTDRYANQDDIYKVRVLAVLKLRLVLAVRLHPGWADIDCPVAIANEPANPCDPAFVDADHRMIIASANCTRVPLELNWKGIVGPRPWSSGDFGYQAKSREPSACCDLLCAIDGLVIPGEVNNTGDADGLQRYTGAAVLDILTFDRTNENNICGGCVD